MSPFYVETLADLSKSCQQNRSPEQEVGIIADKFPELSGTPNSYHFHMCVADLMGKHFPMEGRIITPGARAVREGTKTAILIERSEENKAFDRWQKREFMEIERLFAVEWRNQLKAINYTYFTNRLIELGIGEIHCKTLEEAKSLADRFVQNTENVLSKLELLASVWTIPSSTMVQVAHRWLFSNRPPIQQFAPYAAYMLTVEVFFYIAIASGLISPERASNRVDICYLLYLPFAMVFTSMDKLHRRCAPLFLRDDQEFVWGADFKSSLLQLDQYYKQLPLSETDRGIYAFASHPPKDLPTLISKLWDRHLPDWRSNADIDPNSSDKSTPGLVAEMKRLIDAKTVSSDEADFDSDDADAMIVERKVKLKRGSWYQLPKGYKS